MNGQGSYDLKFYIALINITQKTQTVADGNFVDCKTVRIFLVHFVRVRLFLHALLISLLILRKIPNVLQSSNFGTFKV